MIEPLLLYAILCLIPAFLRLRQDKLGFWGWFLLGILFTPLVSGLMLFITRKLKSDYVKGK